MGEEVLSQNQIDKLIESLLKKIYNRESYALNLLKSELETLEASISSELRKIADLKRAISAIEESGQVAR